MFDFYTNSSNPTIIIDICHMTLPKKFCFYSLIFVFQLSYIILYNYYFFIFENPEMRKLKITEYL